MTGPNRNYAAVDDEDDDPGDAVDYDQEPDTVSERTVD